MAMRNTNEMTYRSLLLGILSKVALTCTREGLSAKLKGDDVEATQCALDAMDLLQAGNWLKSLDESLCPEVKGSTVESMMAYMARNKPSQEREEMKADLLRRHPDLADDINEIESLLNRTPK